MRRNAKQAARLVLVATAILVFCLPAAISAAPSAKKIFTYAIQYDPPSIDPQINFAQRGELFA
ncbi:MAG: hypothetical protein ACPL1K_04610, partial [Candidatus Kryptoniota bacterium]